MALRIASLVSSRPRSTSIALALCVAAAGGVAACGGGEGDTTTGGGGPTATGTTGGGGGSGGDLLGGTGGVFDGTVVAVALDPPAAVLTLDGQTPQDAKFTLKATFQGGSTADVSPEAVQFDRPDLASLSVGTQLVLTAPGKYAGKGTLHAVYKGLEATAELTVIVHVKDVDPALDPAIVDALDQPNLPADPAIGGILYPYDATVFPRGLASPLWMWNAPGAADVYRVHYQQDNYTFDGYYTVAPPASARAPQAIWDKLVASNPGGALSAELSRYDVGAKTAYLSAAQKWTIAPASLRGAIYYWTTSGAGQMARIPPGGSWEPINEGACMGCHAVSSDGSTLVAAWEGMPTNDGSGDNRAWVSFNLPDATVRATSTFFAGNVAVNNDGKYTVFGSQKLRLGDTATGLEIQGSGLDALPLAAGASGLMTPAFSPDGLKLTAVEGTGTWYHNLVNGRLVVMDFDPVTQMFSNYAPLVNAADFPAGQRAIAYPTFSPDSKWIAFHVGDYATGCDVQGCDDLATQIGTIAMQSTSGGPAIGLKALSDPPAAGDQNRALEPTFNPIERGGYFWVVFTSMRDYGNRITGTPNNGKKRLWVAAIDKDPAPGADPSHPAFFLEGQDETTTNMRGFWALSACIPTEGGGGCQEGFECCSGFCDMGVCIDPEDFSCVGIGGDCQTGADCCNNDVVECIADKCVAKEPE